MEEDDLDFLDDLLADVGESLCTQAAAAAVVLPPEIAIASSVPTKARRRLVFRPQMCATAQASTPGAFPRGIFQLCQSWRRQVGAKARASGDETLARVLGESLSLGSSGAGRATKLQRFGIAGTGRIIFTVNADLPPLFHDQARKLSDSRGQASSAAAAAPVVPLPQTGKDAAKQKMLEWGEEWAEEEELPEAQSSADSYRPGPNAAAGLSKEIQREAHLAQARINKVMTSKRQSKYNN